MSDAEEWAARHYGKPAPLGLNVRMWVEYAIPDEKYTRTQGIMPFDVPFSEWNAKFADALVRVQCANLAKHMAADYPAEAAAIEQALAGHR